MSINGNTLYHDLFSSLVSDIKSYDGNDPLLPWLRGIRKMKETLPPQLLKEKLPRFLQKCAEDFLTDRRYSNDLRYLRVWLQLMDFVDNPKGVLRTMEMNHVGMKKSLFYQAYALYYEKMKKFDAAERIYHLGAQNLAEPADELQKAYEQFLHRMKRHQNKRDQLLRQKPSSRALHHNHSHKEKLQRHGQPAQARAEETLPVIEAKSANMENKMVVSNSEVNGRVKQEENRKYYSDDTVVVKFVDAAIVGKSGAEDARHHGLVEPTINTREARNAINSMFQEPLEPSVSGRKSRKQSQTGSSLGNEFKVFSDADFETREGVVHQPLKDPSVPLHKRADDNKPFEIYADGEENDNEQSVQAHAHVFAKPNDLTSECSKDPNPRRAQQVGLWEDTVVHRFVGSTISNEPEVENVCHHGLVEPTINLKEAMNDINSMFGKPIEFARKSRRSRKNEKAAEVKQSCGEFLILPDDESDKKPLTCEQFKMGNAVDNSSGFLILPDDETESSQDNGSGLFEQTLCTKEAMDEINKLFAMPMDF